MAKKSRSKLDPLFNAIFLRSNNFVSFLARTIPQILFCVPLGRRLIESELIQ